jgi:uncharacterized coiled-coil protein SlyX
VMDAPEKCARCGWVDSDAGSELCCFCEKETPEESMKTMRSVIVQQAAELEAAREKLAAIEDRVGPVGWELLERARGATPPLARIETLEGELAAARKERDHYKRALDHLREKEGRWVDEALAATEEDGDE